MGNVQAYIPQHVWPPIIWPPITLGDEFQGFEAAQMSRHLGVLAERDYSVAEVRGV